MGMALEGSFLCSAGSRPPWSYACRDAMAVDSMNGIN